ncbi:PAS domain S-box protein [Desulforhopalus vacuolatus]|uniref:ABC transporter substrate binding protein n=1 Tax=Desulforhopalus vacuolatus TaxID=40414 RepID=UPI0019669F7B|nr:ABC transporter substrate binding protein [Desulforhopalus vacuolatus]MBM9520825.1 PAS domain S-box protein [Desulforhopalus vacuolatus]
MKENFKISSKTIAFLTIGICFFLFLPNQTYSQDTKTSKILILNSYHKGFPWVDGIVEAVESGLDARGFVYDLTVEYMDTKAHSYDAAYKKYLYDLYAFKYSNYKFDAIICSDDHAFDFLREFHKKLFPDTPIVFCAVNNSSAEDLIDPKYFTGVLETPDQEAMIDLALKLHPGLKKIYLIADTTPSGNYRWDKQTVPLISKYPDLEFIRIDDSLSLSEIEDKMRNLPEDAISFYATITRDKTGHHFPLKEVVSRISAASKRPVYTFLKQDLKYGLIGGNVLEGYYQGEQAIDIVIRILEGENIATIPVDNKPTSQFIFSYPQLKRYGINLSDLPEDSVIINRPASFYELNKHVVWIGFGVFAFLVTVVALLVFDITRSRKIRKELLESEEQLRLIFDNSPIGICSNDLHGNFITTNPAYEKMLGYSKEELSGLSFFDITPPDYRPKNKELFQKMFTLGTAGFRFEKKYIRKDGSEINVSINGTAVRDSKGVTRFGTAFVEDITEKKQVEEALRESETRLRMIVNQSSLGISVADLNGRYVSANPAYEKLIGYTEQELQNLTFYDLTHPDDRSVNRQLFESSSAEDSHSFTMEKRYIRKDGTEITVIIHGGTIFDATGMPQFVLGLFEDITERKNLEKAQQKLQAQLIQAQKMESVGRLAGGVAHDFNNMLSIIIGYSESALEKLSSDDPLQEDITEILSAGKRSADITRQLLAFARQQTTAPRVLDLNDAVESMLKMLRRLIGEDIDLKWCPGENVWPVKIDPSQIDQILANLCVNARDAIPGVGYVSIETKNIIFNEKYCEENAEFIPGEYVMLAVSDSGKGIAPNVIDKIFEPFFTTKKRHEGTGLGLSTVYGIIKQNNGFINVYSEIGKGTTLKCYFSRHIGEKDILGLESADAMILSKGETILLVEDDSAILKLGERMLKDLGYTVFCAITPAKAIKIAEKNIGNIDLLITDVVMPEMNGRELSDWIQREDPDIKTLYMSGYTSDIIAHRGVLEEGVCFIQKPLSKQELSVKIREALNNVRES